MTGNEGGRKANAPPQGKTQKIQNHQLSQVPDDWTNMCLILD